MNEPAKRYSCGTVSGPGDQPEVEVFVDQVCLVCGHPPCPCCRVWCDVLGKITKKMVDGKVYDVVEDDPSDPDGTREHACARCGLLYAEHTTRSKCADGGFFEDDSGMCCATECTYAAPPNFTREDGSPWQIAHEPERDDREEWVLTLAEGVEILAPWEKIFDDFDFYGVSLIESNGRSAKVKATARNVERLRAELGDRCAFERVASVVLPKEEPSTEKPAGCKRKP